jgi:hypothetical protein
MRNRRNREISQIVFNVTCAPVVWVPPPISCSCVPVQGANALIPDILHHSRTPTIDKLRKTVLPSALGQNLYN